MPSAPTSGVGLGVAGSRQGACRSLRPGLPVGGALARCGGAAKVGCGAWEQALPVPQGLAGVKVNIRGNAGHRLYLRAQTTNQLMLGARCRHRLPRVTLSKNFALRPSVPRALGQARCCPTPQSWLAHCIPSVTHQSVIKRDWNAVTMPPHNHFTHDQPGSTSQRCMCCVCRTTCGELPLLPAG